MRAPLLALLIAVPGADVHAHPTTAQCRVHIELPAGPRIRGEGRSSTDPATARALAWTDACDRLRSLHDTACEDESLTRVVKRSLTTRPLTAPGLEGPPGLEHLAIVELLPIRRATGHGAAPRHIPDACAAALADACTRAISNPCPATGVTVLERHTEGPPTM